MSEQRFWYGIDGERLGPVSLEEIRTMVREGRLRPIDYIWNEEHQVWTRVTDFLGAMGEEDASSPRSADAAGERRGEADADFGDPASAGGAAQADWGAEAGSRYGGAWINPDAHAGYGESWDQPVEYAGFWLRVGAYIIDGFVLGAIGLVWFFVAMSLGLLDGMMDLQNTGNGPEDIFAMWESFPAAYYAVSILISWIYEAGFVASGWMATPGKRVMGVVVVNDRGERCGFGQASLRYVMKSIFASFTFGLAYLVIAFTERKQGIHDFIAQTYCEKR